MNYVESSCQAIKSKEERGKIVYAYTCSILLRARVAKNDLTFMAIIADPTNSIATGVTIIEFDSLDETERCKVEQGDDF
jgi:hypothetical protein